MIWLTPLVFLAEGLLESRELIAVVRMSVNIAKRVDAVKDLISKVDKIVGPHGLMLTYVAGEDVYLYVTGRYHLTFLQSEGIVAEENSSIIDGLVLQAIAETRASHTRLNPTAVISSFARTLGRVCQQHLPKFSSILSRHIQSNENGMSTVDPLRQHILVNGSKLNEDFAVTFSLLGMKIHEQKFYERFTDHFNDSDLIDRQLAAVPSDIHRSQTFPLRMLQGARELFDDHEVSIDMATGQDGFSLRSGYLSRIQPKTISFTQLPNDRSITKEIIEMQSKRSTMAKGYVYDAELRAWVPTSATSPTVTPEGDLQYVTELEQPIISERDRIAAMVDVGQQALTHSKQIFKNLSSRKVLPPEFAKDKRQTR